MVREYKIPGFYSDQGKGFGQREGPEFELALALQNGRPGDIHLLESLIERYGLDIYRLVYALLDSHYQELPPLEQICTLVEETFAEAISNVNHFWGEASVDEWLFSIALDRFYQYKRWREIKRFIGTGDQTSEVWKKPERPGPQNVRESNFWAIVDDLSQRQRVVTILYYVSRFDVPAIARFLGVSEAGIGEDLFELFDRALHVVVEQSGTWFKVPPDIQGLIQAEITGRLKENIYRQEELRQHLSTCEDCRRYMEELAELDAAIAGALQRRWPLESLVTNEIRGLFEGTRAKLEQPNFLRGLVVPIQKAAWIGVAMMLFIAAVWAITQSGLLVNELPTLPAPATPIPLQLPDPAQIPASAISVDGSKRARQAPDFVYNAEPSLSAVGEWIAFTHYDAFTGANQPSALPEVILYNRIDQSMIRINNPGYESPRINWGFNPSISANGRWVVFTSSEENRSRGQPEPCESFGREGECMGIFLYDRETGNIERIDRSYDGSAVNGESYNPKISADGRWITFWSSADNLVAAGSEACTGETGPLGRCANLFIHNRDTNEIERVPIGRSRERQFTGEAPSISSDGGLLAFTIYKDDWIANDLGLINDQEAIIYAAKEGKFSLVNISMDGSIGNAGSYSPSVSGDGHLVAFVSEASNLVPEDTNGISDVFVQDLKTGMIERVSVSSDGKQGVDSGSETNSPWGPVVDISREGRIVVFTSGANGLSNKPPDLCDRSQQDMCNSIYFHDRETGKTEHIILPQRNRYYLFPDISESGQQVTFMEMAQDCSPKSVQKVCGEIWIYDRRLEWISAVSKGRFQYPEAPTFSSQLREIPAVSANMAFSPDGETMATVFSAKDHTGMINLWELEKGVHKSFIPAKRESTITSLAFSPDGQYLAAGTQEGDVRIWRLSNQQLGYDLNGQTGRVIKILFSHDGRRVAIGTQHSVWVWELRDKTFVRVAAREFQGDGPADLDISPDTKWVALAMEDRTVWLQNIKTGKIVLRLENGGKNPLGLTFSPDGKALAVASGDGDLHLWELVEEARDMLKANYQQNLAHPEGVSKVAFSHNGKYLASLTLEGFLRIWNYPEGHILNTFPEMRWDRVNSFAISPRGELLATSSWTGPTRIFQGPSEVDKPRFFSRVESDEFSIPLAFPPESSLWEWQSEPVTLYRANSLLDFDLQAPVYLPPGLIFKGAYRVHTGEAAQLKYEYYEDPGSAPKGTLFVTQEPLPPVISDMPVGESAKVESVRVKDANAEFVEGDWVPEGNRSREDNGFGGLVSMKWDPGAVFLRLRFQAGTRLISIFYRQKKVKDGAFPYLNKADLVAIAQSLVSVNHSFQTAPITIRYTVQAGDTCTSIASRFGTSTQEIVRLNNLPSNCDRIYEGQALTVPLTGTRETLTETDLDCNGTPERVLLIPNPIPTGTATFLGVIVERLSQIGFYQEAWQYTIGETDLRLFTQPQIFGVNDCIRDLAINLLPRNAGFTQFQIYHWDGETMHNAVQPDLIKTPAP